MTTSEDLSPTADDTSNALDATAPRYRRVAARLRADILAGRLVGGQRLDSELTLAHDLAVSRITVRRALALLQREGLIVTRRGEGSFVQVPRVRQMLARLETLDETIANQGMTSSTRVLAFLFAAPSERVRLALALPPDGEVLVVRRLHVVEGEALAHVEMSLPASVGTLLSRHDVETRPLYQLLPERAGITIVAASQGVRAEGATEAVAVALGIPKGAPVLVCERVSHAAGGEPVNHTLFTYRADRFEFRATLAMDEWHAPWVAPAAIVSDEAGAAEPARAEGGL